MAAGIAPTQIILHPAVIFMRNQYRPVQSTHYLRMKPLVMTRQSDLLATLRALYSGAFKQANPGLTTLKLDITPLGRGFYTVLAKVASPKSGIHHLTGHTTIYPMVPRGEAADFGLVMSFWVRPTPVLSSQVRDARGASLQQRQQHMSPSCAAIDGSKP